MSPNVLLFPQTTLSDLAEIPTPLNAKPGESYLRVDVSGDIYAHIGIPRGATFVILLGSVVQGSPHLVERRGRVFIAQLIERSCHYVTFSSWDAGSLPQTYPSKDVRIVGAVSELYPCGTQGRRWSCHGPAEVAQSMEYPLASAVAN